jgi:hypothetical protein
MPRASSPGRCWSPTGATRCGSRASSGHPRRSDLRRDHPLGRFRRRRAGGISAVTPRSGPLLALLAAGIMVAGCGSGGGASASSHSGNAPASGTGGSASPAPGSGPQTIPAPGPTGLPADAAAVRVIRAWSSALRRGDVRGAARYFALPSEFINGADANGNVSVITIHTLAEAAAVNATLPCGAVLISTDQRGRYVNALFLLTDRTGQGGGCGSGTGQVARTNFVVSGGRIVQWIRAPQDPGDDHRGTPPSGPPAPSSPPSGGPVI